MSLSERLAPVVSNTDLNEEYRFLDADTVESKVEFDERGSPLRFRLQGIDAPEVAKYFNVDNIKASTAGSNKANLALMNLAKKEGFTNVIRTGRFDGLGREIIDLQDEAGRSWENTLIKTGVLDPTRYTSNEAIRANIVAEAIGTHGQGEDWDVARNAIADAIYDETKYETMIKQQAIDETELAYGGNYFMPGSVQYRSFDRDLRNKATSPFATAWDVGLTGAIEGLYGAVEMTGDMTGWDWAKNVGENGIYRARREIARRPEIVTSYKDIDGFFGREGFLQYVANNAAISLPYMAATMSGALASPFVGLSALGVAATGVALSPVALYSGTVWNDMEGDNKNAPLAIVTGVAQTVLDRLGLGFLAKGTLLSKEGRQTAVDALINKARTEGVKVSGITVIPRGTELSKEAASNLILTYSRQETAKLATDAAKFAKDQLRMRNVVKSQLKRLAVGATGEGITEALQESIGYTAAHHANGFRDWNAHEFRDRLIDATIAGTSLGGAFTIPGGIYDYGAWTDVAYRTGTNTGKQTSKMGKLAERDIAKNGQQYNIQKHNNANKTETEQQSGDPFFDGNEDINDQSDRHEKKLKTRDMAQLVRDSFTNFPRLYRGIMRSAFGNMGFADELQNDSTTARIMAEKYGGNLQRSVSGESYENRKHHEISKIRHILGDVSNILAGFGRSDKRKARIKFSQEFYEAFNKAHEKARAEGREVNWETDLEGPLSENIPAFIALIAKLNEVGNRMHSMQSKHNPELGKIKDYLARHRSINKEAVEKNRAGFENALLNLKDSRGRPLVTPEQASELTEAIIRQDGVNDISDITAGKDGFSVVSKATFKPQSHRKRTLNLSDNPEFNEFLEMDLFSNISNAAKSAVRYTVLEEFVGADNKKINNDLAKIKTELMGSGWSEADAQSRVDKLAYDMKRFLNAESGNYKRIQNPIWLFAQKNLLFVTTITGLPLATLSNFVELALVSKSLNVSQIVGKDGSIASISRNFVNELNNTARRGFGAATGKVTPHRRTSAGYQKIQELGFLDWEVGAAHTTGVSETGRMHQRVLDLYFKTILLQQWTNATRASRAAIAGDYIVDKINILIEAQMHGIVEAGTDFNRKATYTNEVAEAEEALRNLGIDPRWMVDYHMGFPDMSRASDPSLNVSDLGRPNREPTEIETERYTRMMNDATFNFVNEAVALPQSGNRPLIFQDPRFALFTQFQGFIATFQANHLPKMWAEMARRGTPAMKYNVFATMSTMILLGFVSQHLKDLLKYGEPTPYFKDMEYIRRGVASSGLLGTSERVLDFAFPMYQERYKTNIGWAFGTISGESAALSKALRIGELGVDVAQGERGLGSAAMKISPLAQAAYQAQKNIPRWNFGDNTWQ